MFDLNTIHFEKVISIVKEASRLFSDDQAASHITVKGLADYVTEVDFAVQQSICTHLSDLYPDIQFLGEEKDNSDIDFSGPVWILDPVDGTTNLIHRFPGSCISLGLAANHTLLAGIIYNPFHDELFFAVKGGGAFLNDRPIHVHPARTLAESLVSTGTAPYYKECADEVFSQIRSIFLRAQDIRRIGSAAIELAYVACGRIDAYFEPKLKPWDFAAGVLILQEAGGTATDYDGNPVSPDRPSSMIATGGLIHQELLQALKQPAE